MPSDARAPRSRAASAASCGIALVFGVSGCVVAPLTILPNEAAPPSVSAIWVLDGQQRSRVDVASKSGPALSTAWMEAGVGPAQTPLIGLEPSTAYEAWLTLEDGTRLTSAEFTTPAPPIDFPTLNLEGTPGWDGFLVVPVLGATPYLAVLTAAGVVTWTTPLPDHPLVGGRPQLMRSGAGLWCGVMNPEPASMIGVNWAGETVFDEPITGFSHDFAELENGELVWIAAECEPVDGVPFCVDTLQRGTPGGEVRTLWRATDTFDPETDGERNDRSDWMHANALFIDEAADAAWLGLRNESVIVKINLETGDVLRQVGGPYSDYALATADAATQGQHRFQVFDDREIVVFDNRLDDERGTRVATLLLDDAVGTVTLADEYAPQPPRWSYMLGDVNRWDDGSTLVTWTTNGVIEDLGPDGTLRSSVSAELGTGFGYTLRLPSLPGVP